MGGTSHSMQAGVAKQKKQESTIEISDTAISNVVNVAATIVDTVQCC